MKMPQLIPDPIRNQGEKDWIPACAGMTMDFHINPQALKGAQRKMKITPHRSPRRGKGNDAVLSRRLYCKGGGV